MVSEIEPVRQRLGYVEQNALCACYVGYRTHGASNDLGEQKRAKKFLAESRPARFDEPQPLRLEIAGQNSVRNGAKWLAIHNASSRLVLTWDSYKDCNNGLLCT
jgi:hypothetical protein